MSKGKAEKWYDPKKVWEEYEKGRSYKAGIGIRGLYEQHRINERFFIGDQWHGVQCGDQKALARYNFIRRVGEYKMSMVDSASLAVCFSAEGVPYTKEMQENVRQRRERYRVANFDANVHPENEQNVPDAEKINQTMDALGSYYKVTAERMKFDTLKSRALERAYTSGTGILYTYWDDTVKTGQFADAGKTTPIRGDIRTEVLDVENVYFGDPTRDDVQGQPYILIVQRRSVEELKREARRFNRPTHEVESIKADSDTQYMAGDAAADEPLDSRKATVITKFYKEYSKDGAEYTVKAVRVTQGATIRPAWDIGIQLYPIAKMSWIVKANCIYGESEVTHLIPNQIAVNRAVTASVDAVMKMGMPILLYDTDVIKGEITNDPGQTIPVAGMEADNPVRYVSPQNFTPQFDQMINSVMNNTMSCAGANDAALGNMRPENTSAILALREAATMPLQLMQNRYYAFIEENARIWEEFWLRMYGNRKLKMEDENGTWYFPFDAKDCAELIINTRVDVGPANLWSEITCLQTLDALYKAQIIDAVQYLERLPKGSVPAQSDLIREIKEKLQPAPAENPVPAENPAPAEGAMPAMAAMGGGVDPSAVLGMLTPEYQDKYNQLTPEQQAQAQAMAQVQGSM